MTVEPINLVNTVSQDQDKVRSAPRGEVNTKPKVVIKPVGTKGVPSDPTSDNTNEVKSEQEEKKLRNTVTEINNKIKESRSQVEFTYHKEVNRVSIKVVDSETQDVIREIPPEDTIEMIKKMWKIAGLLVDKRL